MKERAILLFLIAGLSPPFSTFADDARHEIRLGGAVTFASRRNPVQLPGGLCVTRDPASNEGLVSTRDASSNDAHHVSCPLFSPYRKPAGDMCVVAHVRDRSDLSGIDCRIVAVDSRNGEWVPLGRDSTGTAFTGNAHLTLHASWEASRELLLDCLLPKTANEAAGIAGYEIKSGLCPDSVPRHPRLAPIPAIHFDLHNSSVTDLTVVQDGVPLIDAVHYGSRGILGWICLNFLIDPGGEIYGFCGVPDGLRHHEFQLAVFDPASFDKRATFTFVTGISNRDLKQGNVPINLGYFVMDRQGRVIVVNDANEILFLKLVGREIQAVRGPWPSGVASGVQFDHRADRIAQVVPAYREGFWFMGLGRYAPGSSLLSLHNSKVERSALVGWLSESGEILDVERFEGEVIENGMAVDESGAYIVTDRKLYKLAVDGSNSITRVWARPYDRNDRDDPQAVPKPGTLSLVGSGSTPTLVDRDLIAFTDNAPGCINLIVRDRDRGGLVCEEPLFCDNGGGKSANENTLVAYENSVVAQNWYNSPGYQGDMWGLEPGLVRIDIDRDRKGCSLRWRNDTFASTATVRLSTVSGLLYAPIQVAEDDRYVMEFVDFSTGRPVGHLPIGQGASKRIQMSPSYVVPGGRLVQPVRHGFVVFSKRNESVGHGRTR